MLEQHKAKLQSYFDGAGFERWAAIYGQGELSGVRRTIRQGHAEMIAIAERWLCEGGDAGALMAGVPSPQRHILDAGCGTGLLSVALAQRGAQLTSVDIAPQMAGATTARAQAAGVGDLVRARPADLETVEGQFDAVVCLDVLIHYPRPLFAWLLAHLSRLTHGPLLFTYAPHEPLLAALHWVGGRFPQAQRRTDIQMIRREQVERALAENGRSMRRTARVSRGFYHVTLVEAV